MDFKLFRVAVAAQFERMKKHQLYRTAATKDQLWTTYLGSFPEGSNPIYKTRTEHDCNSCKQFIRAVGNVVAIIDGKVTSIWNVKVADSNYQTVANAMAELVVSAPIENEFLHYEKVAGTEKNFQQTVDGVKTWSHFFINVPTQYVRRGDDIATVLGESRAHHDVLARGLKEITKDSIDTVLELIGQNSLYRGSEHQFAVSEFKKLKAEYSKLPESAKDVYAWQKSKTVSGAVAKIRNSAIGSLLNDLSAGVELDRAVASFEEKVAPTNYKRPTALVTKAMIDKARKSVEELGLTSALERRYATIDDININNILFADRTARARMNADVFDVLSSAVSEKAPKTASKIDEVTIEQFIEKILPTATSFEVLVENSHQGNFVSLVAPVNPTAGKLFKWDNNFSWSYTGEVADSIKERVKAAGGNVSGDVCCRLAWFNYDDLDLHMVEPGVNTVSFRSRVSPRTGGNLDVDMNAGGGSTRTPVENIVYPHMKNMVPGTYTLEVNCWARREARDPGFEVEIDIGGNIHTFAHSAAMKTGETITVAKVTYSVSKGAVVTPVLSASTRNKTMWGVTTNTYRKVNVMMMSPNYWDERTVGNKHYFFMLDGCANDNTARGFFNEFLDDALTPHRKVIEMVGSKMHTEKAEDQLSGVGFSSTQSNTLLCRVPGAFTRTVKIVF